MKITKIHLKNENKWIKLNLLYTYSNCMNGNDVWWKFNELYRW